MALPESKYSWNGKSTVMNHENSEEFKSDQFLRFNKRVKKQ